jgi:NTE family protein
VDPRLLEWRIRSKPGKVDWPLVERDLARLYELGDYETVDFRIESDGGKSVLILGGAPKPPAPTRVRFGLVLNTDFSNSSFGLRLGVYFTRLNALRGELRTKIEVGQQNSILFEFYQPTDFHGRFFVSPTVSLTRQPFDFYVDNAIIARFRTDEIAGALDVGVSLGRYGEVRLGAVRAQTNYKTEIFTGQPTSGTAQTAALRLKAILDQADSVTFPRHGWAANTEIFEAFDSAGGDDRYGKLIAGAGFAKTFHESTVVVSARANIRIGPDPRPLYDQAQLGGFLRLSGLAPGQLYADNAFLARVVAYQRLAKMNSLLGTGVYAGFSLETGNAWASGLTLSSLRLAGSAFLAADTSLGPLYVEYGLADGGFHSFYLALGVPLR